MSKEQKPLRLVKRKKTLDKKTKEQKEALIIQLAKYPILQTACDKAGVGRSTYYLWCKDDKEFKKKANEALTIGKDFINDMCESMLIKNIQDRNNTALIFWLKNHHPDYCEKIIHKYELPEPEVTEEESLQIASALTNIGLASILRKETRNRLDEKIREQQQKNLAIANARSAGALPRGNLEDTIINLGKGKPITIKEHLDRDEESEKKRIAEKAAKDRKNDRSLQKRRGVDLKEFFKKYPIKPFKI